MASQTHSYTSTSVGSAAFIDSIDPATGTLMARLAATPAGTLPAIFDRAREAQASWSTRPLTDRARILRNLRDAVYDARDEVVDLVSRESGKPRVEAIFAELLLVLDFADFLARRAPSWLRGERVPHHNLAFKAKSAWIEYHPHGVVAVISPWNYPFAIPMSQIIAAVVAGNAVVLKPSELTPATGALLAELFRKAGFPDNLVQVIQGGGELGAALIEAAPDKVFFTGSVPTGKRVAEACARKLIPSVLELGGKDAMIVLADADLDVASSAAVWGSFTNCGQACLSVERIYVEQSVAERFTNLCAEKTKKLRVGPASDVDAEVGPMIRVRQLEKVEEQLRDAVERGARILVGGKRRDDLGPNFLEPAVVTGVDHSMRLMREETFGPVLTIRAVASANEAMEMANDSPFALSASVWTRDSRRGREIASQLRAGSVMINDLISYYGICEAPHGASGWGRTHSRFGLLEMVQVKYVDIDRLPGIPKSWWFGYSGDLAGSAWRLVEAMFAPRWSRRLKAMTVRGGARSMIFRRHRI
ncbi:MAG TPA: aldehyde dehydrogenase family protein [Candidatus Acidoferrales bacterium]|nr:aldehyde dehydrogenase family protein [Candidatus Acidoferrales bacterium]